MTGRPSLSEHQSHVRPASGRMVALDSLRGIAALIVVLHHAYLAIPAMPAWVETALQLSPLRPLAVGRPAVIFFFVLSGFVLTLSLLTQRRVHWPSYAAQRSIRLGLPVLAALLVSAALQSLTWDGKLLPGSRDIVATASWNAPWSWADLARQALLLGMDDRFQLNAVLWSLVHEWRVALLLPLIPLAVAWRKRREAALLVAAAALGGWGLAIILGAPQDEVMAGKSLVGSLASTLYFLPAFAAGALLALVPPRPLTRPEALAAGFAATVLALAATDLAVILAAVLLILLARRDGGFARRLRHPAMLWLGRVSFSLYLIHLPLLSAATHLWQGHLPQWAIGLVAVALSLPAAALLHRLAEAPAHRLARRIRPPAPREPSRAARRGAFFIAR